jgi:uncharacterized protein
MSPTESTPESPVPAPAETPAVPSPEAPVAEAPAAETAATDAAPAEAPATDAPATGTPADATPAAPPPPPVVAQPVPEVPLAPSPADLSRIAQDFQIRKAQVETVLHLIDEGNAVPFIAAHRKDRTGGLPEDVVRRVVDRIAEIRGFADRKRTILKSVATQGKLTDDWVAEVLAADHPRWLEDLYQPFKPKKKSLAAEAKAKGWGELAASVWAADPAVADLPAVVAGMIDPDTTFTTPDDVMTGVKHILAEPLADAAAVRGPVRAFAWDTGTFVTAKAEGVPEDKGREYREFFDSNEPVRAVAPGRYMAAIRGERDKILTTKLIFDATKAKEIAVASLPMLEGHPHRDFLLTVVDDAVSRLLLPALEREIRKEWTDASADHLAHAAARNLRSLLLPPPVRGRRLLAIDPGLRTGCTLAALDERGALLGHEVVYPHVPQKRVGHAKKVIEKLIRTHGLTTVVIGNGTGCRDTEHLISDLFAEFAERRRNPKPIETPVAPPVAMAAPEVASPVAPPTDAAPETVAAPAVEAAYTSPLFSTPVSATEMPVVTATAGLAEVVTTGTATGEAVVASTSHAPAAPATPPPPPEPEVDLTGLPDAPADLTYVVVNEAGAAAYANGIAAKDEFPNLDPGTRAAVSIGRRLQDPLAEFCKIDPLQLGPTFHPMDGRPKRLRELLEGVVESAVNFVGADANTSGLFVLRNVAGLNQLIAREIVATRVANGPFRSREHLKTVAGLTESKFAQCAAFLRVTGGDNPLDETTVHPERYDAATKLLAGVGFAPADLRDAERLRALDEAFRNADAGEWAKTLDLPVPDVIAMMEALATPGADPRREFPPPVFKTGLMKMDDLKPGQEMLGTVLNVVPFGAFLDVGVKESGLVHISQMANRYVRSPADLVSVGDVVPVWVVDVKPEEKKLSLTMIPPAPARPPQQDRPPRTERSDRPDRRDARPPQAPRQDRPPQDRSGGGGRPMAATPHKPKRFAEPGAWRRAGQSLPPKPGAAHTEAPAPAASASSKKQRVKPVVTLSGEQKQGKAALNSFGQLFAFIKVREEEPKPEGEGPKAAE